MGDSVVGLPETLFGSGEETFCDTEACRNSGLAESTCPFAHPEGPTSILLGSPHDSAVSSPSLDQNGCMHEGVLNTAAHLISHTPVYSNLGPKNPPFANFQVYF